MTVVLDQLTAADGAIFGMDMTGLRLEATDTGWGWGQVYSIVLLSDGSGLEVRTNDPARAASIASRSLSVSALDAADIRYVKGSPVRPADRHSPSAPWQGGIPIRHDVNISGYQCTSAFGVRDRTYNAEYLVTAEHCFSVGNGIEAQGGAGIGRVQQENNPHDAAIINANASSQVWVNDDYVFNFGAAQYSWDGEYVCHSGYTSYPNRCNIVVTHEAVQWDFGDGKGVRLGVEGWQCSGCAAVAKGDSGGPVWAIRSDGVLTSRGIVSGFHTDVDPGRSGEYILWTETPSVLTVLNLSLQTS
ncbi:hypothetical protein JMF97_04310 [Micromonospora fiedleri]|uniref:Trypsin n=1 Tax=Micromonospora fiedleri TaxID=1157498 RepID=A0ABS1UGB1_9ACTN|nr:hypothetical protein [Micromonospora fiedleri]MBL6275381.1 hypothetical protein [Micromonospora fiedleri]